MLAKNNLCVISISHGVNLNMNNSSKVVVNEDETNGNDLVWKKIKIGILCFGW